MSSNQESLTSMEIVGSPAGPSATAIAAMRAVLSSQSAPGLRTASLEALTKLQAPPPAAFLITLLRRPYLLTTAHQVDQVILLLRSHPTPSRPLAALPVPCPGRAAVRATLFIAASQVDHLPDVAERPLLAAAAVASPREIARAATRLNASSAAPTLLSAADAVLKGKKLDRAAYRCVRGALELACCLSAFPDTLVQSTVETCMRAFLGGVLLRQSPLLNGLGEESVAPFVVPVLDRALRRDKSSALRAIPAILTAFSGVNFEVSAGDLLGNTLVDATQSADAQIRELSLEIGLAFGANCCAGQGVVKCVEKLGKCLKTAKYAYQRTAGAAAIVRICSGALGPKHNTDECLTEKTDLVFSGLRALTVWVKSKKETVEEARASGVDSLLNALALSRKIDGEGNASAVSEARMVLRDLLTLGNRPDAERRAAIGILSQEDFPTSWCLGIGEAAELPLLEALAQIALAKPAPALGDDPLCALLILMRVGVVSDGNCDPSIVAPLPSPVLEALEKGLGDESGSHVMLLCATAASSSATSGACVENANTAKALSVVLERTLVAHYNSHRQLEPDFLDSAATAMVRLAADSRPAVAKVALPALCRLRRAAGDVAVSDLLSGLWRSELDDKCPVASPYDFDDGCRERERLSRVLLACTLPKLPVHVAPLALLAAHHPRLHLSADPRGQNSRFSPSRCWVAIQRTLPTLNDAFAEEATIPTWEESDGRDDVGLEKDLGRAGDGKVSTSRDEEASRRWLEPAMNFVMDSLRLASKEMGDQLDDECCSLPDVRSDTAAAALAGLVRCAPGDESVRNILMRLVPLLNSFVTAAPNTSAHHWESLRTIRIANKEAACSDVSSSGPALGNSKGSKSRGISKNNARATNGSSANAAAAEKLASARVLAAEAAGALFLTRSGLLAITLLCSASGKVVNSMCPAFLSLIMPSAMCLELENSSRRALLALAQTFGFPLRPMALSLSSLLYRLASSRFPGDEVYPDVSKCVHWLTEVCDPPLTGEGFALVAPIVKEAMMKVPLGAEVGGRTSAARAEAAKLKKDAIAVTRAGTQVLRAHCAPTAIDAAVAAAGARAGNWALAVLEREDAAFGPASDALASLAGTALSPGSSLLSQVLGGVISGKSSVREAALTALERLPALSMSTVACPRDAVLGRTLWLGMHDPEEENAMIARDLWDQYGHQLNTSDDCLAMLGLLAHQEGDVRSMSARAIAESLVGEGSAKIRSVAIPQAFTLYLKSLPASCGGLAPAKDENPGRAIPRQRRESVVKQENEDSVWHGRHGVALALRDMADCGALTEKDVPVVFAFLASRGLGDRHDEVRTQMSAAAMSVVSCAGNSVGPTVLLPVIEKQLNSSSSVEAGASREAVAHADRTRENLIMCLGGVAEHLPADDSRRVQTAHQVIKTAIETPSESVQNAAARCLIPLARSAVQGSESRAKDLRDKLVNKLWDPNASYGERRGAAYALAGLIRGLGIKYMKEFRIIDELESAAGSKSEPRRRQGAFLSMETLAILLGRLYEPYTVRALPIILICMGDSVTEVRDACWKAAQASMAEVSSQGVKMILPSLLSGLNDRQWRTKAGAAEVLGAMAFCAPRQLSVCLPQVVPKLAEALADAHPKVVSAAESAIGRIAAVARSPEVRNLSRFLLAALRDPSGRTGGALDAMLATEFVHAIDPASLALLIPPLHRGLRDRSTELKKRAAAIVGSMCNHVSDHKDVAPYLDLLLPGLRATLLDAIPDVRKTSARAIGALAVALGEGGLPGIVPWLVAALLSTGAPKGGRALSCSTQPSVSVASSAERSGAAMGLAEVCKALPDERVEDVLTRVIVAGKSSVDAREGGLMLLAWMPVALGQRFEDRLAMALTSILRGLADDSDNVREAALDAGRRTVTTYAKTSLETLLPELLSAMRDKLWRIRFAATQLLGDFLLVIAGAVAPGGPDTGVDGSGNDEELDGLADDSSSEAGEGEGEGPNDEGEAEDELIDSPETMAAVMTLEATMKAIEDVLGLDRRNEVLAALYIVRCDVSIRVRQMGMQVWKTVVANTPRVLREIMPCAVSQVVTALSDEDEERRAAAGKALGDLSQKLGDRVVPEVLPALHSSIIDRSLDARVRLGASEGLSELVASCPKDQLAGHAKALLSAVCDALCDPSRDVRACGADVFAALLRPIGSTAVDAVVPMLIEKIAGSESENVAELALDSMKLIIGSSGTRLLSIVVPRLVNERPITVESCRALAAAALAAREEFEPYLVDIVDVLVDALDPASARIAPEGVSIEAIGEVMSAVASGGDSLSVLMLERVYLAFNDVSPSRRSAAGTLCGAFCRFADPELVAPRGVSLFEVLIRQLSDGDILAVKSSWQALRDLTTHVPVRSLLDHVGHVRQALRSTAAGVRVGDPTAVVAGLNLPKGAAPFVPLFTEALLHGSPSAREQAALSIADLTEMTEAHVISPFAIKLTGPLIRVISERVPWQVRAAILRALLRLLEKAAPLLRTFAPQLQSTFLKNLSDPSRLVRVRSCAALGALVPVQPRVEALLNDLLALGDTGSFVGARAYGYLACALVFKNAKTLPASSFISVPLLLEEGVRDDDSDVSKAAARALGVLASRSSDSSVYMSLMSGIVSSLERDGTDYTERAHILEAIGSVARAGVSVSGGVIWEDIREAVAAVLKSLRSSAPPVQIAASHAAVHVYLLLEIGSPSAAANSSRREILAQLGLMAESEPVEVRVGVLTSLKKLVSGRADVIAILAPSLVMCAGTTNTAIRGVADRVLRRAFVVSGQGIVNKQVIEAAKGALEDGDREFVDRRILKLVEMPDSEVEEDMTTADD